MKTISVLAFAVLVACSPATKPPSIDEAVTKEVLDHHLKTLQANDVEGVISDYTNASILITQEGTYKGLAEIRENFVKVFQVMPTSGTTITFLKSTVSRDVAYVVWKAVTPTLEFKFATDTFIVIDGKIASQTFAGDLVQKIQ